MARNSQLRTSDGKFLPRDASPALKAAARKRAAGALSTIGQRAAATRRRNARKG